MSETTTTPVPVKIGDWRNESCRLGDCDRPVHVKKHGLCAAHYQQWWRGDDFAIPQARVVYAAPSPDTKVCPDCLRVKNLNEFYQRATGGVHSRCKPCYIERTKEYQARRKAEREASAVAAASI